MWDDKYLPGEPAFISTRPVPDNVMHEPVAHSTFVEAAHRESLWRSLGGAVVPKCPPPQMEVPVPRLPSGTGLQQPASQTHTAPAMQFAGVPGQGGSPATQIVWCEAIEVGAGDPAAEGEAILDGAQLQRRPALECFDASTKFDRWLFEQRRGAVTPSAVLVVGWREAKPCAMAMHAARTSDVSQLRPDARRGELQPVIGNSPDGQVHIAVGPMIIVVRRPEQHNRVLKWIAKEGNRLANADIQVATDLPALQEAILQACREVTYNITTALEAGRGVTYNFATALQATSPTSPSTIVSL